MPKEKNPHVDDDILTMPIDELKKRVAQVLALLAQAESLLPGMIELTDDARSHTSGRFRNGEAEALSTVVDVADKKPALFEALADKDRGHDPTRFEPELIRDRLERAIVLGPLVTAAAEISSAVSDTRLYLGEQTRPVLLAMYELVKPQAKSNAAIATVCKAALDFFSAIGKAAAATRKRNNK